MGDQCLGICLEPAGGAHDVRVQLVDLLDAAGDQKFRGQLPLAGQDDPVLADHA